MVTLSCLLYTSGLLFILEKLIGYADDSTLLSLVPSPCVGATVAKFLIGDLGEVGEWCDLWEMKFNASKPNAMIVSRPRIMYPQSPP